MEQDTKMGNGARTMIQSLAVFSITFSWWKD